MSMRWIRSSLFVARSMSASLATATMVISPLAQGAEAKNALEAAAQLPAGQSREIASVRPRQSAELTKAMNDMVVNKAGVQEYFKNTGLGGSKNITVGEFYSKIRDRLPATLKRDMDGWAALNHNSLMPKGAVSTYKGSDGSEQIRMIFTMPDKKSVTLSYDSSSETKFLKYNNVNLSKKDLLYHEQAVRKIAKFDKDAKAALKKGAVNRFTAPVQISYQEYLRYTPRQRAEFIVQLRYLTEAAAKALKAFPSQSASVNEENRIRLHVLELFLLQTAEAAKSKAVKTNAPCVVNGFFTSYSGKDVTCAGGPTGRERLGKFIAPKDREACGEKQEPCFPLVYGYNNDGSPFCVNRAYTANRDATSKHCPGMSPLRNRTADEIARGDKQRMKEEIEDKKRIIESYMKNKGQGIDLNFNEDGKLAKDQYDLVIGYVNELNTHVDYVVDQCRTNMVQIRKERKDQEDACQGIALRKINIEHVSVEPIATVTVTAPRPEPEPLPVGAPPEDNCDIEKPGSTGPNCTCKRPLVEDPESGTCAPPFAVVPGEPPKRCENGKQPDKDGNCPAGFWNTKTVVGAVVVAGVLCALFCGSKDKPPKHNGPKPFDPCPPAPQPCAPGLPVPPGPVDPQMPPPIIVTVTPTPGTSPTPVPTPTPVPETPPPVVIPDPAPDQPETTNNPSTSTPATDSVRPGPGNR